MVRKGKKTFQEATAKLFVMVVLTFYSVQVQEPSDGFVMAMKKLQDPSKVGNKEI